MSKSLSATVFILLLGAGCTRSTPAKQPAVPLIRPTASKPQQPPPPPTPTAVPSLMVADKYPTIVNIYGWSPEILNIPGKYQCGSYSVTPPDFYVTGPPQNLVLKPRGKVLLSVADEPLHQYDATFSRDCSKVYWVDGLETGTHIHVFDIPSNTTSILTIPNSSFPGRLVVTIAAVTYYPALTFIYFINSNHLLLSFQDVTTGGDAYSNLSTQAIFDLTTQKPAFLTGGGLPLLLNYKSNTLIYSKAGGEGIVGRIETDLNTGLSRTFSVTKPYPFAPPCDPAVLNQADYDACNPYSPEVRNRWLDKLFK